jgi:hypothetical protein
MRTAALIAGLLLVGWIIGSTLYFAVGAILAVVRAI